VITVLDASALLAAFQVEAGWQVIECAMDDSLISTANLSEATAKIVERGKSTEAMLACVMPTGLSVVAFEPADAYETADLCRPARRFGLPFDDRACPALARRLDLPVLTADRAWAGLDFGIAVEVIR